MVVALRNKSELRYIHEYIDPETIIDMAEADEHARLLNYLVSLLEWHYRDRDWYVLDDITVLRRSDGISQDIAPDLAIVKGIIKPVNPIGQRLKSWRIGRPNRPTPAVVFEISSEETWKADVGYKVEDEDGNKIEEYRILGVHEYFAYDPYTPPLWPKSKVRLRGWQYSEGQKQELEPDARGWMYSQELEAWLVPDRRFLRLYDREGNRFLTEGEEERQARNQEAKARTAAEQQAKLDAQARAAAERQAKLDAQARAAAELRATEAERKIAELEARLRQLSQDSATDS